MELSSVRETEALATFTSFSTRVIEEKIAGRTSRGIIGEITKRAWVTQVPDI